ncbi:DMT family transporter [Neobacillus sp. PS3-40]|uniref:DMT family transporter n=1 Tax=Neobacillus sp. PS3-40 TaxID=3070679 RepID=UPI0027DFA5B6|nr:DMT family transporter [Neobacillus sp. PS3-40]WML43547.1 DMT family transporter [Neobacillus sp. PS3-40]
MGKLYSALIGLSLIWGTSFLFMKILLATLDPSAVVFGRCLFGLIMLLVIFLLSKEKIQFKKLPWGKLLLVALANNILPWLLICSSETIISSGLASIINATTPIWTLIIGFLFFASSLKKKQWIGILIGFLGIFILADIKPSAFFSENTLGILLMTGATFFYGLGIQMSKKYLSQLSVLETSFFTMLISTIFSFIIMVGLAPKSLPALLDMNIILPLIGLGMLGSGVAYLLFYFMVKKGGPEFASLVTYLVPVSAVIWGAVLLKESIHLTMIVGLIVIFMGVYISSHKSKLNTKNKAAA